MKLNDAKVLVTGGSSGIGREVARVLAAEGARVAISGRNEARLREAATAIGALPGSPSSVSAPCSSSRSACALIFC